MTMMKTSVILQRKAEYKEKKEGVLQLGMQGLATYIEFDDGQPVYFDKLKLQREAWETQEAQQRLVELMPSEESINGQ